MASLTLESSDWLRLAPPTLSLTREKAAPKPWTAPLTVLTGLVIRLAALVIVSNPASLMELTYSLLLWTFSMTTIALISPIRFRNTAVDTAVKVPNLESIW
jgi:hypothetical protein